MTRAGKGWRAMVPLCVALAWAGAPWLSAAEPPGSEQAEARASFKERRERLRHQLAVELEAVARICGLDDGQRQRLEVAARGVAERLLETRRKAPDPGKPLEFNGDEDEGNAAKADLLAHPVWRDTLREVLTAAQMAALEREQASARQRQREAAIGFAAGLLQNEVRLTGEQRRQMEGLLEKVMPDTFCEPDLDAAAYTHWLDLQDVEKVLTKAQFAYWLDLQRGRAGLTEHLLNR